MDYRKSKLLCKPERCNNRKKITAIWLNAGILEIQRDKVRQTFSGNRQSESFWWQRKLPVKRGKALNVISDVTQSIDLSLSSHLNASVCVVRNNGSIPVFIIRNSAINMMNNWNTFSSLTVALNTRLTSRLFLKLKIVYFLNSKSNCIRIFLTSYAFSSTCSRSFCSWRGWGCWRDWICSVISESPNSGLTKLWRSSNGRNRCLFLRCLIYKFHLSARSNS